jgi:hypothetical protein
MSVDVARDRCACRSNYFAKGSTHPYDSLVALIENCRELTLLIPCPHNVVGWGYRQ